MSLTPLFINKPRTHSAPPPSLVDEQARLAQEQRELERQEQREQQRAERRRAEAIAAAADLGRAVDIDRPRHMASLIARAGRKARGEVVELPPLSGVAAAIIHTGKIRRAEVADAVLLPTNATARAVVLCGMRRRGDRLTESDEAFLSAFLQKMEPRA